jgi:hypothetical protein
MKLAFHIACGSSEIVALRAQGRPLRAIAEAVRTKGSGSATRAWRASCGHSGHPDVASGDSRQKRGRAVPQ